jgi:hypothetical protein
MTRKSCQTKKVSLSAGFKGRPAQHVIAGQAIHDAEFLCYNEQEYSLLVTAPYLVEHREERINRFLLHGSWFTIIFEDRS